MTSPVQRAAARFVLNGEGWTGRSCFSYGGHYDPANTSFGAMVACNEFVLEPGAGFGPHRHAGVDVVTTVLSGVLTHVEGSVSQQRDLGSYVFRTGPGVSHDERNDGDVPVRFVQAWFLPGTADWRPQWHEPAPGAEVSVDAAAFALVVAGELALDGDVLEAGDSLRAVEPVTLVAKTAAHLLAWPC